GARRKSSTVCCHFAVSTLIIRLLRAGLWSGQLLPPILSLPCATETPGFILIAVQTEITGPGGAAVLLGNDVVDLKGKRVVFLCNLAIFAAAACPAPHQLFQRAFHVCSAGPRLPVCAAATLEGSPGLRPHHAQEVPDALVTVGLGLLVGAQASFPGLGR